MMKVCAAIGSESELSNISSANLVQIRRDMFDEIPTDLEKQIIIKITNEKQLWGWKDPISSGYIDIGRFVRPLTKLKVITSVRNEIRTPPAFEIADELNSMDGDIVKGAYMINRPSDLLALYDASKNLKRPHVLLGMGEMGVVSRLRPNVLNNEFTMAHSGTPSAIGQLSLSEMKYLDDDCLLFGLLGHPIVHSAMKTMMTEAIDGTDVKGYYINFDVATLEDVDEIIRKYNIKGMNVTNPYKSEIIYFLDQLDNTAEKTGTVNTILNAGSKLIGLNTDVQGAEIAVERAGIEPEGKKVLIMGTGGVARACTMMFTSKDAEVTVTDRNSKLCADVVKRFGCSTTDEKDPTGYDIIVNCTPVGDLNEEEYPIDISKITAEQVIFDISYRKDSPIKDAAKKLGCKRISGLDMLVGQNITAFETWTGKRPDFDSMRKSVI